MDNSFGAKLKKTAGEMAERLGEAAQTAGERISEMREVQRINSEIRTLKQEKDHCSSAMVDLLMRMFDQNTFAEALLRPEYDRIKAIDADIALLEKERTAVGQHVAATGEGAVTVGMGMTEPEFVSEEAAEATGPATSEVTPPPDIAPDDELKPEE